MLREACLVFLTFVTSTVALRCRECSYFEGNAEDRNLQSLLDEMGAASKDFCKDAAHRADTLDCSELPLKPGYDAWRCVHRDNYMTAELYGRPLTIHLVSRDCEAIKISRENPYKDGHCYHSTEMSQKMQTMLHAAHPDARMREIHGDYCLCNKDNCNSHPDSHYRLVEVKDSGGAGSLVNCGTTALLLLCAFAGQLWRCYVTV